MKSSRLNSQPHQPAGSTEKAQPIFSAQSRQLSFAGEVLAVPGSLNDAGMVRQVISAAMRDCGLSRAQLAERMSLLTGTEVTERMLHNFSAESRGDVRFPSELERAFCLATGDVTLLVCRAELAGLHLVDDAGLRLMELGREFLRQKRAADKIASLETSLREVDLG